MAPLSSVFRCLALVVSMMMMVYLGPQDVDGQTPATSQGAAVEVRSVKFANVRAPGGGDAWLEATVEVQVTAAQGAGSSSRFADRVQIALNLSLDSDGAGFYRASAEAVSLEAGRAAFRFYLPPEILRRERVNTDPFAYAAEVVVRGRPVAMSSNAVSSNVRSTDALRSFKDRIAEAAPRNDGVLVPQYLSPFSGLNPGDTPSFVRRER